MNDTDAVISRWPKTSQGAVQLVVDAYGTPDEGTNTILLWHDRGPWKRLIAYKDYDEHNFPAPHTDSMESFIDYNVPFEKVGDILAFDGSVVINRTRGEISARCHDEQANFLALNLVHDIVSGAKTVQEAREYYAQEFLAARTQEPTPYMEGLNFKPAGEPDPDERLLSDEQLEEASQENQI